jgi:hypothetical protein
MYTRALLSQVRTENEVVKGKFETMEVRFALFSLPRLLRSQYHRLLPAQLFYKIMQEKVSSEFPEEYKEHMASEAPLQGQ